MAGSIKIDDGSGNYTILTNGGSLGSDKTITVPNTTGTMATTNGITEADIWQLTVSITTNADITSNLSRKTGTLFSYIGTGMTQSSGIFTFPSTGIWLVQSQIRSNNIAGDTVICDTIVTDDNFATENINASSAFGYNSSTSPTGGSAQSTTILDITDTTNQKVKFASRSISSGSLIEGSTNDYGGTNFTFIRLGDT